MMMFLQLQRGQGLRLMRGSRMFGRYREPRIAMTSLSDSVVGLKQSAQAVDYTSLLVSLDELKHSAQGYVPCLVENVVQVDDYNIVLGLKGTASRFPNWLTCSWEPTGARIGVGHPPPRDAGIPYSFASTLRSQLKGLLMTDICIATPNERIVELSFSERISEEPKFKLMVEIMGSRSNVVLVETNGNVINAVAYQVSGSSSVRPLQTGGTYQFPPAGPGVYEASVVAGSPGAVRGHILSMHSSSPPSAPPSPDTDAAINSTNEKRKKQSRGALDANSPISRVLLRLYKGLSPNVARSLCGPDGAGLTLGEVVANEPFLHDLEQSVQRWAEGVVALSGGGRVPSPSYPSIRTAEDGRYCPSFLFAEAGSGDDFVSDEGDSGLEYLRDYYESRRVLDRFLKGLVGSQKRLKARLGKAQALVCKFEAAVEAASEENALKAQNRGDLITAYTYAWKHPPGGVIGREETLECFDFETGEQVLIPIPEGTGPSEHASAMYREARKLRRGRVVSEALLDKARLQVSYLEEVAAALEALIDEHREILSPSSHPTPTQVPLAQVYHRLSEDLPILQELEEEVHDIDARPLVEESSEQYRERGLEGSDGGVDEDLDLPLPSKQLRGKEKYLAHRERLRAKKSKIIKASEGRKAGGGKGAKRDSKGNRGSSGSKGDPAQKAPKKRSGALAGLTVLQLNEAEHDLGGVSVVVGRSSKQNARISFQVAKEHHLWFHADGVPGSHCLLMLQPGQEPSQKALQFAADVAAWHSKAKGSVEAAVSYTNPKYLKKVNGGGPGMVTVSRMEGTIYGRPERGRALMESNRK